MSQLGERRKRRVGAESCFYSVLSAVILRRPSPVIFRARRVMILQDHHHPIRQLDAESTIVGDLRSHAERL